MLRFNRIVEGTTPVLALRRFFLQMLPLLSEWQLLRPNELDTRHVPKRSELTISWFHSAY